MTVEVVGLEVGFQVAAVVASAGDDCGHSYWRYQACGGTVMGTHYRVDRGPCQC